ncbi:MAG: transcriptional regulator [Planctomycetes bacterium]|nr:transcriptional regulator [Planctomycetota bacterium]
MNSASKAAANETQELPQELIELSALIAALPSPHRSRLSTTMDRVVDGARRRRRILTLVQEALGQLRLDMKYLMFDLEATRRERDAFRRGSEGDADEA